MKTKKCHGLTIFLFSILFFSQSFGAHTQVIKEPDWKAFVKSSANYLIKDTFYRQTFEGKGYDLWNYTSSGDISLFDASTTGIKGQEGNFSLKLPAGSSVRFENPFINEKLTNTLSVKFAANNLSRGDGLRVYAKRKDKFIKEIWALSKINGFKIDYGQLTNGDAGNTNMANPIGLSDNPEYIELESFASGSSQNNAGFFCIDEVYAYGDIPCYSLFSGEGIWGDKDCWSHFPPSSERKALIEGICRLTKAVHCKELHLKGKLTLEEGGVCIVDTCYLYGSGSFNFRGGQVIIKNKVYVSLELPQKGKWYFFSSPFDVYPDEFAPNLLWGKGEETENGNYFYLMEYDNVRRAQSGLSVKNWQLISSENLSANKPVIEKNKGYLLALDKHANTNHITFGSSQETNIAYSGSQFIALRDFKSGEAGEEHQGWYLCGNPFPGSFALKDIQMNEKLDGYVYLYKEGYYQSYPLNNEYIIPPYSTFFIKTSGATDIDINILADNIPEENFPVLSLYDVLGEEPEIPESSLVCTKGEDDAKIRFKRVGRNLFFENAESPVWVYIADLTGNILYSKQLQENRITLSDKIGTGLYIAIIYSAGLRHQYKFILNE